jgi:hypothetical protein
VGSIPTVMKLDCPGRGIKQMSGRT